MKIRIDDRTYRARTLPEMPLQVVRELKQKYGKTIDELAKALKPLETMQKKILAASDADREQVAGRELVKFLSDDAALEAFMLNVWMTRRAAGEDWTLEESSWFELSAVEYLAEDGDELKDTADTARPPGARTDSVRAGAKAPQDHKPKAIRSKTSSSRSTPTSD